MPTLIKAVAESPETKAFQRVGRVSGDDPLRWQFEPRPGEVVADGDRGGFFVLAAFQIFSKDEIGRCFMDISLPERINDYAYSITGKELRFDYRHKFAGEIIPAIAIDGFGFYDLFYSKKAPDVGIDVLRHGLAASKRKHFIAEDLGYILRDEERYQEAAEMFQLAADEGVSSCFIYGELAAMYAKLGDLKRQKKYAQLYQRHG